MNPSPLKLDLPAAHCISLELQFNLDLPAAARQELSVVGSRESGEDDRVFFHQDYRQENQKLHSWAEVQLADHGESDILVEYLTEGELEDQTDLHQTEFTLAHLFDALQSVSAEVAANFTLRFELDPKAQSKFIRMFPYNGSINSGMSVEYRGAHIQLKTPEGASFDLWFDLRPDDSMEATLRFTLDRRPSTELPGEGLRFGVEALARVLKHSH